MSTYKDLIELFKTLSNQEKEMKLKGFAMAAWISNQAWMAFKNIAMNHMIFKL